jgi:hypothetical protein
MDKRAQNVKTTIKKKELKIVSVMDMKPKLNKAEALSKLREMAEKPDKKPPTEKPSRIAVKDIYCFPAVFQRRPMSSDAGSVSMRHIQDMAMTLKAKPDADLPPVSVIRIGSWWVLCEGHHRLSAYLSVGRNDIPVRIIQEGLDEARGHSVAKNTRNQLPMYRKDRIEAAWDLVNIGAWVPSEVSGVRWKTYYRQAEIADKANVDISTVERQVKIRKALAAKMKPDEWGGGSSRQYSDEDLEAMPYWKARLIFEDKDTGTNSKGEYHLEERVKHYREALRKALPAGAWKEIEAISAALIALNENGAGRLAVVINDSLGGEGDDE